MNSIITFVFFVIWLWQVSGNFTIPKSSNDDSNDTDFHILPYGTPSAFPSIFLNGTIYPKPKPPPEIVHSSEVPTLDDDHFFEPIKPKPKPKPPTIPSDTAPIIYADIIEKKIFPKDSESFQRFGSHVNVYNDMLVVGTNFLGIESSVYLFCNNDDTWIQNSKLYTTLDSTSLYDGFGLSFAIDSGHFMIGAMYDNSVAVASGIVYVYKSTLNQNTQCLEKKEITMSDFYTIQPQSALYSRSHFGKSISISNNIAVIGAPGISAPYTQSGEAFVFVFDEITQSWEELVTLAAYDPSPFSLYGDSVSIYNNNLIVSAQGDSYYTAMSGAIYVYDIQKFFENEYTINFVTKLYPQDLSTSYFGYNLKFDDSIGLVSGYGVEGNGVVYVFEHLPDTSGYTWTEVTSFVSKDVSGYDRFGESLEITTLSSGEQVFLVGAPGDNKYADTMAGSIYFYMKQQDEWTSIGSTCSNSTDSYDSFGKSIAVNNGTVFVGAEMADGYKQRSGAVYIEVDLLSTVIEASQVNIAESITSSVLKSVISNTIALMIALLPIIALVSFVAYRAIRIRNSHIPRESELLHQDENKLIPMTNIQPKKKKKSRAYDGNQFTLMLPEEEEEYYDIENTMIQSTQSMHAEELSDELTIQTQDDIEQMDYNASKKHSVSPIGISV